MEVVTEHSHIILLLWGLLLIHHRIAQLPLANAEKAKTRCTLLAVFSKPEQVI